MEGAQIQCKCEGTWCSAAHSSMLVACILLDGRDAWMQNPDFVLETGKIRILFLETGKIRISYFTKDQSNVPRQSSGAWTCWDA